MRRTAHYFLVIGSFLLVGTLVARQARSARDQDQSNKWIDKGNGVSLQVVSNRDEWPELAVLKLTNDAYGAFTKNPAGFINNVKVFSVPVRDPSPAGVTLIAPQDAAGGYYVMVAHGHTSTSYTASVPAPPSN
ncbi:MAG TPA: hypothetical protein VMJ35_09165 [Dongiaceae bacterium]|nr:hypothetical protein [Dongiaceae bacterium]